MARIRPAIFHSYDVLPKLFPHYLSRNFIFRFGKGSGVGITAGQVSVKTKFSYRLMKNIALTNVLYVCGHLAGERRSGCFSGERRSGCFSGERRYGCFSLIVSCCRMGAIVPVLYSG